MKRYVILISGRGSNMLSLLDAGLPGACAAVISNRPDAAGLALAAARGIAAVAVDHRGFAAREDFDAALANEIERHAPDLVGLTAPFPGNVYGAFRIAQAIRHATSAAAGRHTAAAAEAGR